MAQSDAKMASPSRRSARKKARVSYDESLVEISQEEEMPKRRGPPKKRAVAVANFSSGSEDAKNRKSLRHPRNAKRQEVL